MSICKIYPCAQLILPFFFFFDSLLPQNCISNPDLDSDWNDWVCAGVLNSSFLPEFVFLVLFWISAAVRYNTQHDITPLTMILHPCILVEHVILKFMMLPLSFFFFFFFKPGELSLKTLLLQFQCASRHTPWHKTWTPTVMVVAFFNSRLVWCL